MHISKASVNAGCYNYDNDNNSTDSRDCTAHIPHFIDAKWCKLMGIPVLPQKLTHSSEGEQNLPPQIISLAQGLLSDDDWRNSRHRETSESGAEVPWPSKGIFWGWRQMLESSWLPPRFPLLCQPETLCFYWASFPFQRSGHIWTFTCCIWKPTSPTLSYLWAEKG